MRCLLTVFLVGACLASTGALAKDLPLIDCPEGTTWKGNEIRIKDYDETKSALEQYCVKNNVNHGPYMVYYKDSGMLASEGSFVEGKLDGWLRDWRESGKKKQEHLFSRGTLKEKIEYDLQGNVTDHKRL